MIKFKPQRMKASAHPRVRQDLLADTARRRLSGSYDCGPGLVPNFSTGVGRSRVCRKFRAFHDDQKGWGSRGSQANSAGWVVVVFFTTWTSLDIIVDDRPHYLLIAYSFREFSRIVRIFPVGRGYDLDQPGQNG